MRPRLLLAAFRPLNYSIMSRRRRLIITQRFEQPISYAGSSPPRRDRSTGSSARAQTREEIDAAWSEVRRRQQAGLPSYRAWLWRGCRDDP
jgi:hypothetical protein